MIYEALLLKHPIISDQINRAELAVILDRVERQIVSGSVKNIVEFGCYAGTTSLFIRRLLDEHTVNGTEFHVYDSFEGLPEKRSEDLSPVGEQFRAGELSVSKKDFTQNFKKAGLRTPTIHKGWFHELSPGAVPDAISFAFLDGDYYESVRTPLELIWPKLTKGAVVIVDDYANEALPGAAKAVDEWLRTHPAKLRVQSSLAVISTE